MLNFRVSGEGKTIVFLHGFLESLTMWDYLPLEQLGSRNIFIDLPGHGKSPLTDKSEHASLEFMADEVIAVLAHLEVAEFSLVGHSMGAYVGLLIKQKLESCNLLVLLNSNFWCDNEQKKIDRLRVVKIVLKAKNIYQYALIFFSIWHIFFSVSTSLFNNFFFHYALMNRIFLFSVFSFMSKGGPFEIFYFSTFSYFNINFFQMNYSHSFYYSLHR